MFQFPGCPPYAYEFSIWYPGITLDGFPHSEIHGSRLAYSSPWLIAVSRVLHRRMAPWHPPCALIRLIFSSLFLLRPTLSVWLSLSASALSRLASRSFHYPSSGLFLNLLLTVQLSRCRTVNPENDTGIETQFQQPSGSMPASLPASLRTAHASAFASSVSAARALSRFPPARPFRNSPIDLFTKPRFLGFAP